MRLAALIERDLEDLAIAEPTITASRFARPAVDIRGPSRLSVPRRLNLYSNARTILRDEWLKAINILSAIPWECRMYSVELPLIFLLEDRTPLAAAAPSSQASEVAMTLTCFQTLH